MRPKAFNQHTGIAAMPTTDPSEGFSGLQLWSEPLIFDRLQSAYFKLLDDEELARGLTRLHARVYGARSSTATWPVSQRCARHWCPRSNTAASRSIIWRKSTPRS